MPNPHCQGSAIMPKMHRPSMKFEIRNSAVLQSVSIQCSVLQFACCIRPCPPGAFCSRRESHSLNIATSAVRPWSIEHRRISKALANGFLRHLIDFNYTESVLRTPLSADWTAKRFVTIVTRTCYIGSFTNQTKL